MKVARMLIAGCLAVLMMAPPAGAQSHVVSKSSLEQAVKARVAQEDADREAIRSLLRRAEVREIAKKAGLSIEKADAGVAMLQGADLQQVAQQARQAQDQLAGGATVVITTTTIILILLVIIIIVLVAD